MVVSVAHPSYAAAASALILDGSLTLTEDVNYIGGDGSDGLEAGRGEGEGGV